MQNGVQENTFKKPKNKSTFIVKRFKKNISRKLQNMF